MHNFAQFLSKIDVENTLLNFTTKLKKKAEINLMEVAKIVIYDSYLSNLLKFFLCNPAPSLNQV